MTEKWALQDDKEGFSRTTQGASGY